MIINGKSSLFLRGRSVRVLSHRFNKALPKVEEGTLLFTNEHGEIVQPAKNKTWRDIANAIRSGKASQARVE
jgi:hypothetical protein